MVHLDDFQFTSQAEETDQLVADTAKQIGHFFDKEDKKPMPINYSKPTAYQIEKYQ